MANPYQLLRYREREGVDSAIIFIHGFNGHPQATWRDFAKLIVGQPSLKNWDLFSFGYGTSMLPDIRGIWKAKAGLHTLAKRFCVQTDFDPFARYKKLTILAHSMGGLIVQRALLDHESLRERADHVFLFGTPSGGVPKARWLFYLNQQYRDLYSDSDFMINLRNDWVRNFTGQLPFRLCLIAGDEDDFIPLDLSHDMFDDGETGLSKIVVGGDHSSIVRPPNADALTFRIVSQLLTSQDLPHSLQSPEELALAKNGQTEVPESFTSTNTRLTSNAFVPQYALKLNESGQHNEAIAFLEKNEETSNSDAMGVLAGIYKRRWITTQTESDAKRSLDLYQRGLIKATENDDIKQRYYHSINIAFMSLAYLQDYPEAQKHAWRALKFCQQTDEDDDDYWRAATLGDAYLYLGNLKKAVHQYRLALSTSPPTNHVRTIVSQALRVAELLDHTDAITHLARLFAPSGEVENEDTFLKLMHA